MKPKTEQTSALKVLVSGLVISLGVIIILGGCLKAVRWIDGAIDKAEQEDLPVIYLPQPEAVTVPRICRPGLVAESYSYLDWYVCLDAGDRRDDVEYLCGDDSKGRDVCMRVEGRRFTATPQCPVDINNLMELTVGRKVKTICPGVYADLI